MRSKPVKMGWIIGIICLLYVLGVIVGFVVICYIPGIRNKEQLWDLEGQFAEQYAGHGTMTRGSVRDGIALMAFDYREILLDQKVFSSRVFQDFISVARKKDLKKVLDGTRTYRLELLVRDRTKKLGYTSLAYIGMPMYEGNRVTGAMIWIVELRDLPDTLMGFFFVFTAFFVAAGLFTVLNLSRQRKYEQMRRNYTDNITHALKSPVASIKALTEALSDGMEKSPADRNVYYGMIIHEANRQEKMIHDVLELSRLQSFDVNCKKETVPTGEVLGPVIEKYSQICDLMEVTFTVSDELNKYPELYTDATAVRQVLGILIDNALKFVGEDGEIVLSAAKNMRRLNICVSDNGKGIPARELPHIFERFYKANRNDNEYGNGLGLSIAKEIVANLGEKIWVKSEEGKGTQAFFTVRL